VGKIRGYPNLVPFSKDRQPPPGSQHRGWERKREAMEIMNLAKKYQTMTASRFRNLGKRMEGRPERYTMREVMIYRWAVKMFNMEWQGKFFLDWVDRNVSKAPGQHEISGPGGDPLSMQLDGMTVKEREDRLKKRLDSLMGKDIPDIEDVKELPKTKTISPKKVHKPRK